MENSILVEAKTRGSQRIRGELVYHPCEATVTCLDVDAAELRTFHRAVGLRFDCLLFFDMLVKDASITPSRTSS